MLYESRFYVAQKLFAFVFCSVHLAGSYGIKFVYIECLVGVKL